MTTYVQYIICVDNTNIDYNNKGPRKRDSHMEINTEQKCTQEVMINNNIKMIMKSNTYLMHSAENIAVFRCLLNVSFSSTVLMLPGSLF